MADEGLVVIGAGLMRTGTNSLQVALERLLNGPCYHMNVVQKNPHHAGFWKKAATDNPSDDEWRRFLSDYKAVVDLPPAAFYKELMQVYPNAKVVLSVRDPEKWFVSVSTTIAVGLKSMEKFPMNLIVKLSGMNKMLTMINAVTARVLGPHFDMFDKARMITAFNQHVEEVRRHVPPDQLLEFQATDGWGPLCSFLGVEVPDEPYPRVNTMEEMQEKIKSLKLVSTITAMTIISIAGGVAFLSYRYGGRLFSNLFAAVNVRIRGEL